MKRRWPWGGFRGRWQVMTCHTVVCPVLGRIEVWSSIARLSSLSAARRYARTMRPCKGWRWVVRRWRR